ncbi:MAG: hypothetical protein KFB97_02960 [Cyanobium sp. M30B3]|nr:MAG: hypothetical protein KFB97_02960 [Cyanobium sp. M30B3]
MIKGTWKDTGRSFLFRFDGKRFGNFFDGDFLEPSRGSKWARTFLFDDANGNGKFDRNDTVAAKLKVDLGNSYLDATRLGSGERALLNSRNGSLRIFYGDDLLAKGRFTGEVFDNIITELMA